MKKKKKTGFGSSKFLVPTVIGAGIGASAGFIAPPLSVQGAVIGAGVGGWIGLKRAGLKKKVLRKMERGKISKFMKKINKATTITSTPQKVDVKAHKMTRKWTPLEKKILKIMVGD